MTPIPSAAEKPRASFLENARRAFRTPVLAPLMEQRVLARAVISVAAAHLALAAFGVSLWQCPVREVTGVPCPGCGLTRAVTLLLHGDFLGAMKTHAYAPLLLLALALLLAAAVLPREYSQHLVRGIAQLEKRVPLGAMALALLPIYWIARLVFHVLPF